MLPCFASGWRSAVYVGHPPCSLRQLDSHFGGLKAPTTTQSVEGWKPQGDVEKNMA